MFKFTQLIQDCKSLLVKVLIEQQTLTKRVEQLGAAMKQERSDDRAFVMSIITLLHTKAPVSVTLPHTPDPFEELPVGSAEGYSPEELGIYDSSQAAS